MRIATVRALGLLLCAFPAVLLGCGGSAERERVDENGSDNSTPSSGGAAYRITHEQRSEYSKKGLGSAVVYTAELRGSPDELAGTGRYEGKLIVRKISWAECNEPPKEHAVSGNIEASGGVVEVPGAGKIMSYTLATTDWKKPGAATAEEAEAMKGAGTVAELLMKLTGSVTQKVDTGPGLWSNSCLGEHIVIDKIKVEEISR
jgi:hypothetical protein